LRSSPCCNGGPGSKPRGAGRIGPVVVMILIGGGACCMGDGIITTRAIVGARCAEGFPGTQSPGLAARPGGAERLRDSPQFLFWFSAQGHDAPRLANFRAGDADLVFATLAGLGRVGRLAAAIRPGAPTRWIPAPGSRCSGTRPVEIARPAGARSSSCFTGGRGRSYADMGPFWPEIDHALAWYGVGLAPDCF